MERNKPVGVVKTKDGVVFRKGKWEIEERRDHDGELRSLTRTPGVSVDRERGEKLLDILVPTISRPQCPN
jgi:hypothetical protein